MVFHISSVYVISLIVDGSHTLVGVWDLPILREIAYTPKTLYNCSNKEIIVRVSGPIHDPSGQNTLFDHEGTFSTK